MNCIQLIKTNVNGKRNKPRRVTIPINDKMKTISNSELDLPDLNERMEILQNE